MVRHVTSTSVLSRTDGEPPPSVQDVAGAQIVQIARAPYGHIVSPHGRCANFDRRVKTAQQTQVWVRSKTVQASTYKMSQSQITYSSLTACMSFFQHPPMSSPMRHGSKCFVWRKILIPLTTAILGVSGCNALQPRQTTTTVHSLDEFNWNTVGYLLGLNNDD